MKRFLPICLMSCVMIASLFSSSWSGGYKISLSGYNTDIITQNEHLAIDIVYSPIINSQMALSLYGGYSFSNLFFPVTQSLHGGLSFSHLIAQEHFLDPLFIRDSALWATVDISFLSIIPGVSPNFINLSFSPLSIFFGDKLITIGSIILNYDLSTKDLDWGVKLFELTHYMW